MELKDLLLKKEELPILHETGFQIPIHPKLLEENTYINPNIPKNIFPQVAEDWYNDLEKYVKTEKDESKKEWINEVFLKNRPNIENIFGNQILKNLYWENNYGLMKNGFVESFSISRNGGGSLYFDEEDFSCGTAIPGHYIKFSKEKSKEFSNEDFGEHSRGFVYAPHNIDSYPGALFLRNWGIKYMNEVFKETF